MKMESCKLESNSSTCMFVVVLAGGLCRAFEFQPLINSQCSMKCQINWNVNLQAILNFLT